MMNRFIGIGRLARDPDIRHTQDGLSIGRVSIAIDRARKQDGSDNGADFIPCVFFGKTAEFAERYLFKGMKVAVEGRLQTGSYEKDGNRYYTTDVVVEKFEFADGKREAGQQELPPSSADDVPTNIPDSIDSDLPFK